MRVQASTLNVGSDVTIQRFSFLDILELILHSCNVDHLHIIPYTSFSVNHMYNNFIPYNLFSGSLYYFFLDVSIIP